MRPHYDTFQVGIGRSRDPQATWLCHDGNGPLWMRYGLGARPANHDVELQPGEKHRLRTYAGIISIFYYED